MNNVKIIKCPHCEKSFNYYTSEYRPFCCEKCKMIDLGNWLNESYVVETKEPLSDEDLDKLEQEID